MVSLQSLRSVRLLNVALFDVIVSAIGLWFVSRRLHNDIEWWRALVLAIPVGVLVHIVFGISTPLTDEILTLKLTHKNMAMLLMLLVGTFKH